MCLVGMGSRAFGRLKKIKVIWMLLQRPNVSVALVIVCVGSLTHM